MGWRCRYEGPPSPLSHSTCLRTRRIAKATFTVTAAVEHLALSNEILPGKMERWTAVERKRGPMGEKEIPDSLLCVAGEGGEERRGLSNVPGFSFIQQSKHERPTGRDAPMPGSPYWAPYPAVGLRPLPDR
ncbi:hypothetical protein AAFF_G00311660 [Aldrovandia affinis]|uniref:Uncharacterized protein n=1 Tax=Aldrovandia affinis TaxID=143900 RepID=A0AAD7SN40_9TELE|nr:hypothetical protein AAFF_G00311660 [Aldrovandia affinis]